MLSRALRSTPTGANGRTTFVTRGTRIGTSALTESRDRFRRDMLSPPASIRAGFVPDNHPRMSQVWPASVFFLALSFARGEPPAVEAVVLGIAQDGGVPHLECRQKLCVEARRDPSKRRRVASLGLIDRTSGKRFLIDATPDFEQQV